MNKHLIAGLLLGALACGSGDSSSAGDVESGDMPDCSMPPDRTIVQERSGAVMETWQLALHDVQTSALPDEPAFLDYRAAIRRDEADLLRPVADPAVIESEEMAAVHRDESFNADLVFDEGVGAIEPISCLDALLFARQASRLSQIDQPTEFVASVLRQDTEAGTNLLVVFAAGSEMFVPRGFYGFDLLPEYLDGGWSYWYVIHNHTVQKNGDQLALGPPIPSTSDVDLYRSLVQGMGLEFGRVTNGFYTFIASADELHQFRGRQ